MSYHSTIFKNKQLRKFFTREQLMNMTLINIKGKPAKTKNCIKQNKDGTITVFGNDFVAKVFIKNN